MLKLEKNCHFKKLLAVVLGQCVIYIKFATGGRITFEDTWPKFYFLFFCLFIHYLFIHLFIYLYHLFDESRQTRMQKPT